MHPSCVNGGGSASIPRLPTNPSLDEEISLGEGWAEVLSRWQVRSGEIMTAVDPEQGYYRVRLTAVGASPRGVVFARLPRPMESRLAIEVYQAIPDKERFELILQKLTELGVARITPVETTRSTTYKERNEGQAKSHRWPDIVLRAARQCRRAALPELLAVATYTDALECACTAEIKLMLFEGEEIWNLTEALGRLRPERVALLVGPEGGFTAEEVAESRAAGFLPVGLGPRILRTETAAIVGVALLQGLIGDLC